MVRTSSCPVHGRGQEDVNKERRVQRRCNSVAATSHNDQNTLDTTLITTYFLKAHPLSGPLHEGPYLNTWFSRSNHVHTIVASSNLEVGIYLLVVCVLGGGHLCKFLSNLYPRLLILFDNPNCYSDALGTPPRILKHVQEIVAYLLFVNQR